MLNNKEITGVLKSMLPHLLSENVFPCLCICVIYRIYHVCVFVFTNPCGSTLALEDTRPVGLVALEFTSPDLNITSPDIILGHLSYERSPSLLCGDGWDWIGWLS